ncbi:MAG: fructose-bisphosphatase class III, partial [Acetatifactor sp.]|nr:fructose-bisphosphatase class III [Acetatifactor sp.]
MWTTGIEKGDFMNEMEQKVLKTLSHQYKTQAAASTEIINLQSILNLPKGTEHF